MPKQVKVVCDSSTLISIADTCNIDALALLRQKAGADFVIPPGVEEEIVVAPSRVKSLEFSALRIRRLVEDGTVRVEGAQNLASKTQEIADAANRLYLVGGKPLKLIHGGEAETLALLGILGAKILAIDEKTTRLIIEDPLKLKEMIEGEYTEKMVFDLKAYEAFRRMIPQVSVIRSAELLALAAKRGFFSNFGEHEEEAFHSAINALRAAGCSLAQDEMQQYEQVKI